MASPPLDTQQGHFINGDGATIRYAVTEPRRLPVRGVAIVTTGFQESVERYYELMHDLHERGYAVWAMDWRGQGGSQRYHKDLPQRPHAQGYENDAADLSQFINRIIRPNDRYPGAPRSLFAHSMGGNIALRFLHDHPGLVDNAVITAPMLRLNTGLMPHWASRQVTGLVNLLGGEGHYVPGTGDWRQPRLRKFERERMTNQVIRQNLSDIVFKSIPSRRLGGPTFGWLREAFRSMMILREPDYLREIKTPILLVSPKRDKLVHPKAHDRAARYLPDVRYIRVPESRHSIWMESDALRQRLWQQVDRFLDQNRASRAPAEPETDESGVSPSSTHRRRWPISQRAAASRILTAAGSADDRQSAQNHTRRRPRRHTAAAPAQRPATGSGPPGP